MANDNKMINGQVVEMTDTEQTSFNNKNTAWTNATAARRMTELRKQRDFLLAETDWMGNQDYSITDAWATYRQALRDVTSQTPSNDEINADGFYTSITFPTKPS